MRERHDRRPPACGVGRAVRGPVGSAILALATLLVGACVTAPTGTPTATEQPRVLGIDWARSNPVERPAEAFDVPSDRPFSTGLGNSGHQLNFPGQAIMSDVVRTWRHQSGGVLLSASGWNAPYKNAHLERPDLLAGRSPRMVNMSTIGDALLQADPPIEALVVYNSNPVAVAPESPKVVDRKSTRLNSSHIQKSRMPSSA